MNQISAASRIPNRFTSFGGRSSLTGGMNETTRNSTGGMTTGYRWRRTHLMGADGLVVDDWGLEPRNGDAVARIYRVRGGPRDGRWFWAFRVDHRADGWLAGGVVDVTHAGRAKGIAETTSPEPVSRA